MKYCNGISIKFDRSSVFNYLLYFHICPDLIQVLIGKSYAFCYSSFPSIISVEKGVYGLLSKVLVNLLDGLKGPSGGSILI